MEGSKGKSRNGKSRAKRTSARLAWQTKEGKGWRVGRHMGGQRQEGVGLWLAGEGRRAARRAFAGARGGEGRWLSSKDRVVSGAPCQAVRVVTRMRVEERFLAQPPFRDLSAYRSPSSSLRSPLIHRDKPETTRWRTRKFEIIGGRCFAIARRASVPKEAATRRRIASSRRASRVDAAPWERAWDILQAERRDRCDRFDGEVGRLVPPHSPAPPASRCLSVATSRYRLRSRVPPLRRSVISSRGYHAPRSLPKGRRTTEPRCCRA
ncbi:hypothetical protein KM043_006243 [Ampulex compressa]|nr:hypothetical protein KM043_006243 [Ampulex compressa]